MAKAPKPVPSAATGDKPEGAAKAGDQQVTGAHAREETGGDTGGEGSPGTTAAVVIADQAEAASAVLPGAAQAVPETPAEGAAAAPFAPPPKPELVCARVISPLEHDRVRYEIGATIDLPLKAAEALRLAGVVEPVRD